MKTCYTDCIIGSCEEGYYFDDSACIQCKYPCSTCASETECITCPDVLYCRKSIGTRLVHMLCLFFFMSGIIYCCRFLCNKRKQLKENQQKNQ